VSGGSVAGLRKEKSMTETEAIHEISKIVKSLQDTVGDLISCVKIVGERIDGLEKDVENVKVIVGANNIVDGK
jgi:hypothetical protein